MSWPTAFTAVAMSGGLDSSVVAALLARAGEPVVGLSMLLWDRSSRERSGRCCGSLDLGDARRVAGQIGIPHYTLRLDAEFERQVVDPFVGEYVAGRTPSPCVRCNTFIKFDAFVERARRLGASRIATGHYARLRRGPDGLELHRGVDEGKDQSYYLFELRQEQLEAVVFPLGELTKIEVREEARRQGLHVAEKGESMEICFVEDGLGEFLAQRVGRAVEGAGSNGAAAAVAGRGAEVVDRAGRRLGTAGGPYYRYTVGQRRGLGVGGGEPLYVLEVASARNRVVVGGRVELRAPGLRGERLHWIGPPPPGEIEARVRIRSRHPGAESRIRSLGGGRVEVEFAEPQEGVAPGQAAVFYDGTRVLGGCWIEGAW
ncbi:MAG TPA: tRNA 2-thiouridine(34) synthase MnmA [Thermoanaerobaculia bacterium]|nr:tRNA 2-thiouridine(34) synthase MnmA [Thermoanaerobaculia bacterium]